MIYICVNHVISLAFKFHNANYANQLCRPSLERSLLSPLEMSLMPRRPGLGDVSDDGFEPRGDRPVAHFRDVLGERISAREAAHYDRARTLAAG